MEMYEVNAILEKLNYKDRVSWEQTRFLSYVLAQINSRKTLNGPQDIMTFPWDEKVEDEPIIITKSDIDRLTQKMNQYIADKTQCQQI